MSDLLAPIDPAEKLDYGLDWSEWLAGDQIVASTWGAAPAGFAIAESPASGHSSTDTWVWITVEGPAGYGYALTNTITTGMGRVAQRTIVIDVKEKVWPAQL